MSFKHADNVRHVLDLIELIELCVHLMPERQIAFSNLISRNSLLPFPFGINRVARNTSNEYLNELQLNYRPHDQPSLL